MKNDPLILALPMPIHTPRLLIRAPHANDGRELHAAVTESFSELHEWMTWADKMPSLSDSDITARQGIDLWNSRKELRLPFFDLCGKTMMGSTGLIPLNRSLRSYELGYWIRSTYAGRGYVTEAANAAIRYAFLFLRARRVEVRCDEDNQKSRNIIKALGFQFEGRLVHQDLKPFTDVPRNTLVYGRIDLFGLPELSVRW
jgi:RimJ/RimL family protein N-acetyltransferase